MKLSRSLPLVLLALPALAHCGGDSGNGNPGGGATRNDGGDAIGGADGDPGGSKTQGGTKAMGGGGGTSGKSQGGTAQGGSAQGGEATGGAMPQAGDTSGGDGMGGTLGQAGGSDMGGDGGAGGTPDVPGPLTFFDYYHDGTSIYWVNPSGSGKLKDSAFPEAFRFAEGDVDGQGKVTARRNSVLYLDGGMLYRLDGAAYSLKPKAPVRVSNLQGIQDICYASVVSNLADRAQSMLIFQYETAQYCKGVGMNKSLPLVSVPLLADANTTPTSLDVAIRTLVDGNGKLLATLMLTPDGRVIRATSLTDATELQAISNTKYNAFSIEALSLGGPRFLLLISRPDISTELFTFNANTNALSASLGKFSNISYPSTGMLQNDTDAFFVGVPWGDNKNQIYRFPVDGSAAPVALTGIAPTTPAVSLVGLTSNRLVYRQIAPLTAGIYSIPPDADFSMPPAATTIVGKNVYPALISEQRLFYQEVNLAKAVNLDGSHDEYYSLDGNTSHWAGCTTDAQTDYPTSRQKTGNCQRVYIEAQGPGFQGGKLVSYDADAAPGQDFFMNAARGTIQHGAVPDELTQQPELVDASRSGYNPFQTTSNALVTGVLLTQPTIKDDSRYAIFYLADPAGGGSSDVTFVAPLGTSTMWLSRGP